jgi:hypothetical protein
MNDRLKQAYRQAPWRKQIQWVGTALGLFIAVLLIMGIYLHISGMAAQAGLEAQDLRQVKEDTLRMIASSSSKLGLLTSSEAMEVRALEKGFHRAKPEEIEYIYVDEYPGRQTAEIAPPPDKSPLPEQIIKPSYRQSLWEWLFQGFYQLNQNPGGLQP